MEDGYLAKLRSSSDRIKVYLSSSTKIRRRVRAVLRVLLFLHNPREFYKPNFFVNADHRSIDVVRYRVDSLKYDTHAIPQNQSFVEYAHAFFYDDSLSLSQIDPVGVELLKLASSSLEPALFTSAQLSFKDDGDYDSEGDADTVSDKFSHYERYAPISTRYDRLHEDAS